MGFLDMLAIVTLCQKHIRPLLVYKSSMLCCNYTRNLMFDYIHGHERVQFQYKKGLIAYKPVNNEWLLFAKNHG